MHSKFELAKNDRKLLGRRLSVTPANPNIRSPVSGENSRDRRRSTQVFRNAIAAERLPKDLQELLPVALWPYQMGLLVMFLYDFVE